MVQTHMVKLYLSFYPSIFFSLLSLYFLFVFDCTDLVLTESLVLVAMFDYGYPNSNAQITVFLQKDSERDDSCTYSQHKITSLPVKSDFK